MEPFEKYTIRSLTGEDIPFLYEMLYLAIFVPEGGKPPPPEVVYQPDLSKYVQDFGQPNDLGFMAVDRLTQKPAGAAWLRLFTTDQPSYGFIDKVTPELTISLRPEFRGQGIGRNLLETLITAAKGRYAALSLSVWPANPAYRLYQRLGFEVVGINGPAVTMVKQLDLDQN